MTATPLRATANNNNSNSRPLEKFPFDICEKMGICLEKKNPFSHLNEKLCVATAAAVEAWRSLI